jgi:hypothetical protein
MLEQEDGTWMKFKSQFRPKLEQEEGEVFVWVCVRDWEEVKVCSAGVHIMHIKSSLVNDTPVSHHFSRVHLKVAEMDWTGFVSFMTSVMEVSPQSPHFQDSLACCGIIPISFIKVSLCCPTGGIYCITPTLSASSVWEERTKNGFSSSVAKPASENLHF